MRAPVKASQAQRHHTPKASAQPSAQHLLQKAAARQCQQHWTATQEQLQCGRAWPAHALWELAAQQTHPQGGPRHRCARALRRRSAAGVAACEAGREPQGAKLHCSGEMPANSWVAHSPTGDGSGRSTSGWSAHCGDGSFQDARTALVSEGAARPEPCLGGAAGSHPCMTTRAWHRARGPSLTQSWRQREGAGHLQKEPSPRRCFQRQQRGSRSQLLQLQHVWRAQQRARPRGVQLKAAPLQHGSHPRRHT